MKQSLQPAQLVLDNGSPYSTQFGDIYFSPQDGVGESEYNFIVGNHLPTRWQCFDKPEFTIAETGFGTGLNFLLTVKQWLQSTASRSSRLHYISAEKHPIDPRCLTQLYQANQWQSAISQTLLKQYPEPQAGCYSLSVAPSVTLTLLFGDAITWFNDYAFVADAWYLDGFAPTKNPDLWSDELFAVMAKRSQTGTTFATFTAASAIRRGLANVGFQVEKHKGFGRKRERLIGCYRVSC